MYFILLVIKSWKNKSKKFLNFSSQGSESLVNIYCQSIVHMSNNGLILNILMSVFTTTFYCSAVNFSAFVIISNGFALTSERNYASFLLNVVV